MTNGSRTSFAINDLKAGVVVFLVALPLCLGIGVASEATPLSGIISGIVGGILVGTVSGSKIGVSGPAAGLTAIVATAIVEIGSFEGLLVAVMLAGVIQYILGVIKAGLIGYYFPNSVIKGMLGGIGLILILKQIPHALGDDKVYQGDEAFLQSDGSNTFTEIALAVQNIHVGALIIFAISMGVLMLWGTSQFKKNKVLQLIPGPLVVVIAGVLINELFRLYYPSYWITGKHLVTIPLNGPEDARDAFVFPDFNYLSNAIVWKTAGVIALIASLETLLCVEATDKLDPNKNVTPANRELKAQGIGNAVSGLLGGLPVTQVIVRSSANITAGGTSKVSAIFHGVLLVIMVFLFPNVLKLIPLSALAAILFMVGYKLVRIPLIVEMFNKGWNQFLPFSVTIVTIAVTDLLTGIAVGSAIAIFFLLRSSYYNTYSFQKKKDGDKDALTLQMAEEVSFLNKGNVMRTLKGIPENTSLTLDFSKTIHLDPDVREIIENFRITAQERNIDITIIEPQHKKKDLYNS